MAFSPRDIQAVLLAANNLAGEGLLKNQFNNELQFSLLTCKLKKYVNPLTLLVILDSKLAGSFDLIRFRVNTNPSDEQRWVLDYLLTRYHWMKNTENPRIDRVIALLQLVKENNWSLTSPFKIGEFICTELPSPATGEVFDSSIKSH